MSRSLRFGSCAAVIACLLTLPALRADSKTTVRVITKFSGPLGAIANHFGGAAAKDGVVETVAIRGQRLSRINDYTGQIIDLGEQKVYALDVKKKQYTVKTFDEIRAEE